MAGNSTPTAAQDSALIAAQSRPDTTEPDVQDPLAAEKALNAGATADVVTADNIHEILANLRAAGISLDRANFAYLETHWEDYAPSPEYQRKAKEQDGFEAKVKALVAKAAKSEDHKGIKIEHVFDANPDKGTLLLKSGKRIRNIS